MITPTQNIGVIILCLNQVILQRQQPNASSAARTPYILAIAGNFLPSEAQRR